MVLETGKTDRTLFPELRKLAASSGQGVAAVTLPTPSTSRDQLRNCEKFIQTFKDWCELNGWVRQRAIATSCRKRRGTSTCWPMWLLKTKAVVAFRSAITGNEELENLVRVFQLIDKEKGTGRDFQILAGILHGK